MCFWHSSKNCSVSKKFQFEIEVFTRGVPPSATASMQLHCGWFRSARGSGLLVLLVVVRRLCQRQWIDYRRSLPQNDNAPLADAVGDSRLSQEGAGAQQQRKEAGQRLKFEAPQPAPGC
jgi:hypothetical protein